MYAGVLACLILSVFVYQDFKYRHINGWFLIPLTIILLINGIQTTQDKNFLFSNMVLNLIFLVIQFFLLGFYFFVKERNINIVNNKLGIGDILLFLILCISFSFKNYIIFYIITLIFSLVISMIMIKRNKDYTIPLAGYTSLMWIFWLIYSTISKNSLFFM